jgi:hypothetical protein
MVHTTNYVGTFIAVAPDCTAKKGTAPKESAKPSAALLAFRMISEHPYEFTSDDVLFMVHAERTEIPRSKRESARKAFLAKPQACLRASDLGKRYGWGIHHDRGGRVALYGVESAEYGTFASGNDLDGDAIAVKSAMRSSRK